MKSSIESPLAIHGGQPVRSQLLPYGKQWITPEDEAVVHAALQSDYLTTGPSVEAFEKALAEKTGAAYAVSVSNGTAALHAACHAAGIGPGDEVITTPITFAASANAVLYQGGTPVFADIDPLTWNIDPTAIEKAITPRTKAIIPVDFTGQPANMEAMMAIAEKHGLIVIEDAAHSLGGSWKGTPVGCLAHMTTCSFHPVKLITTGEGGAVVTSDAQLAEKLRLFRSHGITKAAEQSGTGEGLEEAHGPWYQAQRLLGYNYRLTDLQSALGISQLKKIHLFLERRQQLAAFYQQAFLPLEALQLPHLSPEAISAWHLYVIRLRGKNTMDRRRWFFDALRAENIGVNVHYLPVYWHPYYQQLGYQKGICPQAEAYYESCITLPLYPAMSDEDASDVVTAVKKVLAYEGK
ncbi:UDP-4-amino-4,6-dideoxy-N-acetyl-beta-L-altrosamine transaminase [Anoxynatronum sibiricum]|uniref:UDP-4-amino-4, 6-dideoxy-N-acetyl-beta-L-altrosamine transaminase n=1 Tax=Anoxynatronum sibiricum TaxID=210623 RepID=A0ABU9VUC1_9CLOT